MNLLETGQADQLVKYLRGTQPPGLFVQAAQERVPLPPVLTQALQDDLDIIEGPGPQPPKVEALRRIIKKSEQR